MAADKLPISTAELVQQYNAGRSTVELARQHNCHPGTVRHRLIKAGVKLRSNRSRLAELSRAELEQMVLGEALSDAQIGHKYGVSHATVRMKRVRLGIPSHPRNAISAPHTRNGKPTRAYPQQQEAAHG
ncbi:MAG: hypothetical protein OHK0022_35290 [Roseiflexaceae bacterium]